MSSGAADPGRAGAAALEAALAAEGVRVAVHAEGRLALLSGRAATFASAPARDAATRLARLSGFTHVALVLDGGAEAVGAGVAGPGPAGAP